MIRPPPKSTLFPYTPLFRSLRYGDDELAATIFHELAHQLLYVRGDSEFNEAFATTVEDAGLERWLTRQGASQRLQQLRERRSEEHTSELQSPCNLVCRLLLE